MRKRRAGGTAALVLLSLLAGCGASGPEAAGSGLEEVLWRVDAPLETGETASLLENSRGQRLLLVGEETVLEGGCPLRPGHAGAHPGSGRGRPGGSGAGV